jgi:hypothetical protein
MVAGFSAGAEAAGSGAFEQETVSNTAASNSDFFI